MSHRSQYEHAVISRCLQLAMQYDGLNVKRAVAVEYLHRRRQEREPIERIQRPDFANGHVFTGEGESRTGALMSSALRTHNAQELAGERAILKATRKAQEARDSKKTYRPKGGMAAASEECAGGDPRPCVSGGRRYPAVAGCPFPPHARWGDNDGCTDTNPISGRPNSVSRRFVDLFPLPLLEGQSAPAHTGASRTAHRHPYLRQRVRNDADVAILCSGVASFKSKLRMETGLFPEVFSGCAQLPYCDNVTVFGVCKESVTTCR